MSINKIKNLLQERIGLNPDSVGESSIKIAVGVRQDKLGISASNEYLKLLAASPTEINELIEEVVVPETWFFRNKLPFCALAEYAKTTLYPRLKNDEIIRILSIPCSTGEEPYSIAMALLNEGLPDSSFKVDAVDISKRALTKAKRAIYGKNSFRDVEDIFAEKYFRKIHSGQQLDEKVKGLVNYRLGNLLVGSLSPHPAYYDIVFCRNLLIYFNREIQTVALDKLHRALKPDGLLFVGHVETTHLSRNKFSRYDYQKSFAYRKKPISLGGRGAEVALDNKLKKVNPGPADKSSDNLLANLDKHKSTFLPKKVVTKKRRNNKLLVEAEKLETENNYEKAITLCKSHLQDVPDSAQAYYLLGLIHHSRGENDKSESLLKKSVYLDPNHENAMILSLLLAELRGDIEAVQSFQRRITRIEKRNKS